MAGLSLGYAVVYLLVSEVYLYGWGPKDVEIPVAANFISEAKSDDNVSGELDKDNLNGETDMLFDDDEAPLMSSLTR
jgi:hypothetical protein